MGEEMIKSVDIERQAMENPVLTGKTFRHNNSCILTLQ